MNHKIDNFIKRLLFIVLLLGINIILGVITYIPFSSGFHSNDIILKAFSSMVIILYVYSFYLMFARLSGEKIIIYVFFIFSIIFSLSLDNVNRLYQIDSCLDKGNIWDYKQHKCIS